MAWIDRKAIAAVDRILLWATLRLAMNPKTALDKPGRSHEGAEPRIRFRTPRGIRGYAGRYASGSAPAYPSLFTMTRVTRQIWLG
jgi:hypothetical protein